MKERLKALRKSKLNLTQQEFADRIGIKRGAVANYEIGRNIPTDSVILLICREFGVSEEWLRTGEGEMFPPRTQKQVVTDFLADIINEPESFKTRLIEGLANLEQKDWKQLENVAMKILNTKKD